MTTEAERKLSDILDAYDRLGWKDIAPTCACILAVSLGVPTPVARWLLEHRRHREDLFCIDIAEAVRSGESLAEGLLDSHEINGIKSHPGPLEVYFNREHAADTARFLQPLLVQLGLMLSIFNRVIFRDSRRLKWVVQAAVQALRARARQEPGAAFPIGDLAAGCERLGDAGAAWAIALRDGSVAFESFDLRTTTQLRVLMHLALLVGEDTDAWPQPWTLDDLHQSTPTQRRSVLARFGNLLVHGLESPPELRDPAMTRVLTAERFQPLSTPLDDGVAVWWRWLLRRADVASGWVRESYLRLARQTLLELDPAAYPREAVSTMARGTVLERDIEQILHDRSTHYWLSRFAAPLN